MTPQHYTLTLLGLTAAGRVKPDSSPSWQSTYMRAQDAPARQGWV